MTPNIYSYKFKNICLERTRSPA